MKKQLIAAIVGGIILFVWQFLSWAMLNIHGSEMMYTDKQDEIMEVLNENLSEGKYFLPSLPADATAEEEQRFMEGMVGKPWAQISYHPVHEMSMSVNMVRGLVINMLSIFLLVWVLMKFETLTMSNVVISSLIVGAIGYFNFPYINSIWFETSTMGYIIDTIVQWGLAGTWLGWWLTRK